MKKLFSLILALCWIGCLHATTLHVEQTAGSDFAMAVKQIGKLVINGTSLQFFDRQGTLLYTSDMETVRVMTFDEVAESSDPNNPDNPSQPEGDGEENQGLEDVFYGQGDRYTVYPNPTSTTVIINGLESETTLRLYSLEGQLLKTAVGTSMNVEEIANGTYLLQCENQIIKIIKQ